MEAEELHQRVAIVPVPAVEPLDVEVIRVVGEWVWDGLAALARVPDVAFFARRGL